MASNNTDATGWVDVPITQAKKDDDAGWVDAPMKRGPDQKDPGFSWSQVAKNVMDPNYHVMDQMRAAQEPTEKMKPVGDPGSMSLAIPMEAAPVGLAKLAAYLGKNAPLRIGANSAAGAVQGAMNAEPGQGAEEAKKGALLGGGLSGLGELVGGIGSVGKALKGWGSQATRMNTSQAEAYLKNPQAVKNMVGMLEDPLKTPELQNQASEAIQNSRRILRLQGLGKAKELSQTLKGKELNVDPTSFQGHSDEADALIQGLMTQKPAQSASEAFNEFAGTAPKNSPFPVEANDVNSLKRALQQASEYGKGTPVDPVQMAKNSKAAQAAAQLRSKLETVDPAVQSLNKSMQESVTLQEALRKGLKSPLSFVSTEAPDRVANLARAENKGAGGLLDFGSNFGAAKAINAKNVGSGGKLLGVIPPKYEGMLGRKVMQMGNSIEKSAPPVEANPFIIQALLGGLFNKEK